MSADEYCIALTTMPDEAGAASLARAVVEARLAACVQIVAIRSVYAWEGSVEDASEWLLLMKTRADRYAAIEEFVAARHPYDVPEILQVPVSGGLAGYLGWVDEQTAAAPG